MNQLIEYFENQQIEHLLEEYNNSKLDLQQMYLSFDVPEEVLDCYQSESDVVKQFLRFIFDKYRVPSLNLFFINVSTIEKDFQKYLDDLALVSEIKVSI